MQTTDGIAGGEIRDSTRNSHNAGSAATGEPQLIHRLFDKLCRIRSEQDGVAFDLCIAGRTGRSVAVTYGQPGTFDSFRDYGARLTPRSISEFRSSGRLNFDREVDPVEDGTTDSVAVILTATRCMAAFPFGIP